MAKKATERNWDVWDEPYVSELVDRKWARPEKQGVPGKYLACILENIEGKSILDVGCGVGRFYSVLPPGEYAYLGVDYSRAMLKVACSRYPEAKFRKGDAYDLSRVARKDTVVGIALLIHLPDVEKGLGQLWSRAKKCLMVTVRMAPEAQTQKHPAVRIVRGEDLREFPDGKHLVIQWDTPEGFDAKVAALPGVGSVERFDFGQVWIYKINRE